ncbi:MAG: hypothetical protein NXH73_06375 [Flavobacteriaceae bacterium]|nr:hypothetical protein [Flavobacteriaceae bacterium]
MTGHLLLDILLSLVLGVVSTSIFAFILLRVLSPNIKISDKICCKLDDNGDKFFFFKIINKSIYDAYSVEFELYKKMPYIVDKTKVNHRTSHVKLSRKKIHSIPRYKKAKGYGDHAVLIRTFVDLSLDIDTENLEYVLFVKTKHGLSNLTKVTTQTFENSNVFHDGHFKFGKNLGVC